MTGIAPEQWWSETESPKAWMSVRDADLYEQLLHRLAVDRAPGPLSVLEWGAGRSTAWYTGYLANLGVPYRWLALEHNAQFVEEVVRPSLAHRPDTAVLRAAETTPAEVAERLSAGGTVVVSFDYGMLRPDLPDHEADRLPDLDDYVHFPAALGLEWDLAVVDGRKRRRCVLQAASVLNAGGYVALHDAWRKHYQCAWSAYASGRRFGDEWWIGSARQTDFTDVLPWYALERHAELPEDDPRGA